MKEVLDISYLSLFFGYALLIIPFYVLWHYKTGLLKDSIIAISRMTVQLLFVGVYLEFIFKINNSYINVAWVLVMAVIASHSIIKRSSLSFKTFFIPVFVSGLFSIIFVDLYFFGVVIKLDNIFEAQYLIPITGMLLGNTIRTIIIALNSYYGKIRSSEDTFRWYLANGATLNEALLPFKKEALKNAFNPVIATTAIVGLVSLPGMMTGQILGGSSPNIAVKYQIMLMITIFASGILSVITTLLLTDKYAFDKYNNLKSDIKV